MKAYLVRRFLLIIPTFLGVTFTVFMITRIVPGGPLEQAIVDARMRATSGDGGSGGRTPGSDSPLSEEQLDQLREYYGLDKPFLTSYFLWLQKILQFDLGFSTRYGESVWESIKQRLPVSATFGGVSLLLTYLICIPLGVLKALRHRRMFDHISSILVFVGYAVPGYVVALGLMLVLGSWLQWLPLGGLKGDEFETLSLGGKALDLARHALLPLIAYVIGNFAVMTFLVKNSLIGQLSSDYMRTALAKGLSFRQAVLHHALRNSLIPIATGFGNSISFLLAGSFLIEKIFNIDGLGLLGYEAVVGRDYPVVMGVLVISALLQLVGNILSDVCVAWVDPRVQFH